MQLVPRTKDVVNACILNMRLTNNPPLKNIIKAYFLERPAGFLENVYESSTTNCEMCIVPLL